MKIIKVVAYILIIFSLLPINSLAASNNVSDKEVIHLSNGCYYVIEIQQGDSRAGYHTNGSKDYTYYSSNDVALWKSTLTGDFYYDGSTSTCTAASTSVAIYNSSWSLGSKSASKSENTATGNFVMVMALLFNQTLDVPVTLTLTCDKNGNLS